VEWECCWLNNEIRPEECPYVAAGEEELYVAHRKRLVEKCLECPGFRRDLSQLSDRDYPMHDVLRYLVDEFLEQRGQLQSLIAFHDSKTREIKFLHELSMVLQTSLDLDEVLSVAMTAITSGKGFGMNRAFLLMADRERQCLKGYLGVGPRNYDEAWRIWSELEQGNYTLKELARHFHKTKISSEKVKFQDVLERLTVPYSDQLHVFNRALRERKPILVTDAFHNPEVGEELARILEVDSFLVMPLISRNRRIGVLLADNFVTHRAITTQDLQSMEIFTFPVAFALERASLYEKLQEEIEKQTAANIKLQEQQELIVKMEKMAVVGRITSSIAHSIRNPLMTIGGYARSLLKDVGEVARKRDYLEEIVREAKHLEDVLEEVLYYSESLYPVMDRWDINQLVRNVCRELSDQLTGRNIALTLDLDPDIPTVLLDYKQIAYCLKTILQHIIETQPGVGSIWAATGGDSNGIRVTISDDGASIDEAVKEALITPFTSTQELGIGVGLPLCRIILERHGSTFSVADRPEGGTAYTFVIPLRREDQ
jgi:signal transduction histidine kinase